MEICLSPTDKLKLKTEDWHNKFVNKFDSKYVGTDKYKKMKMRFIDTHKTLIMQMHHYWYCDMMTEICGAIMTHLTPRFPAIQMQQITTDEYEIMDIYHRSNKIILHWTTTKKHINIKIKIYEYRNSIIHITDFYVDVSLNNSKQVGYFDKITNDILMHVSRYCRV
jgi:hypothetical protein